MRFSVVNSEAERRDGLKALLRQIDRQARFNEARDWTQASRALQRTSVDLLVVDWQDSMRLTDIRALLAEHPSLRIAALIDDASLPQARALLGEGVRGVIPRAMEPLLIVHAFERVLLGGHFVSHRVLAPEAPPELELSSGRSSSRDAVRLSYRRIRLTRALSPRQEQIMRCVHMGSTNKMIARTLGISEGTVKIHLASVFQQLGALNRAAAVAIYNGWQSTQLEVLRAESDSEPKPALGQAGPIPLRRSARFKYPQPDNDDSKLPIAAEPVAPFGKTESDED
ncbi:response regulator transcription factor [Trinickia terrae]|uniref:Response regulator transcription factor n=1 Tax=Trinickia terrae TaxID=2571161 RepID=A0A4U1HKD8_9BURK|nr:response regulator transcription factor [Trinickia terrae]TKC80077.1 response regulator transcription factor [Trinickia terrae]